jgi:large repetitive protein
MGSLAQEKSWLGSTTSLRLAFLLGFLLLASCSGAPEGAGPSDSLPSNGTANVAPVVITSPIGASLTDNSSAITISGTCISSAIVVMVGDATTYTVCQGSSFSFKVSKTTDNDYNFSIYQGFSSTRYSASVPVQWTRDTAAPGPILITSPGSNPFYSNGNGFTLQGNCESGATVSLSGSTTASATCASGSFAFNITGAVDGTYNYSVAQRDAAGNQSQSSSIQWLRSTSAPAAPTVVAPTLTSGTYLSSSDFQLQVTCLANAQITLRNVTDNTTEYHTCGDLINISAATDGTRQYTVSQTDAYGNSSPASVFNWNRLSTAPFTPVLQSVSPIFSNGGSQTFTVSCDATGPSIVHMSKVNGSMTDPAATCTTGSVTLTVSESIDGSYTYTVYQTRLGINSGSINMVWNRDSVAPAAPILITPAVSPFYSNSNSLILSGSCETNSTVNLSGTNSYSDSTTCSNGSFSFTVTEAADATYSFSISQTDLAGNSSSAVTQSWVLDTAAPAAVTVTSYVSPYSSNGSSVVISGACESGANVVISGAMSSSVTCSSSAYSFTSNKSSDGTYNYSLSQTDLAGNSSPVSSFSWQRITAPPSAPTITNPGSSPYRSYGSSLAISGACTTGYTVTLGGSGSGTITCTAGTYSLSDSESTNGTYNYTVTQTDLLGNTSAASSLQWIRDNTVPPTPVITSPSANPYYSNGSSLTISGTCSSGYTVLLSGGATGSTTCLSGGTFSIGVNQSTDGTYALNVVQQTLTGVNSAATTLTWNRVTNPPVPPTVVAPAADPIYTNGSALTISGACTTGYQVSLAGDASGTTQCSASNYSFSVAKSADGTYNMIVYQTDLAGNMSASAQVTWIRNTVPPAAPTLVHPVENPFGSGDTNLVVSGVCSPNATVNMNGAASSSVICSSLGAYAFSVSKSVDGTYNYAITQTDLAGNTSAPLNFQWVRDSSIPATPLIVVPVADPYYSNQSTLTMQITCDTTGSPSPVEVEIGGDIQASDVVSPAGSLTQNCTSSPVTFVVNKTVDGTYTFTSTQTNPNNGNTSASDTQVWVRDTTTPPVPTITSPSGSPYTAPGNLVISGSCEVDATVALSGSSTQSQQCSSGLTYSFNVVQSTDATYNFSVIQTDLAGNHSTAAALQWIRNSSSMAAPIVTSPTLQPYLSNSSNLTISGTCTAGYLVNLTGVSAANISSPAGLATEPCTSAGTFSYVINATSDATYTLTLTQTFNSVTSPSSTFVWQRSTVAPVVTITSQPPSVNSSTQSTIAFSSNETGSVFQCSLDTGVFASCSSPVTYAGLAAGSHTFRVKAVDLFGNIGSTVTASWTQAAYNTLALYHLDSSSPTSDSSFYGTNTLTVHGATTVNTTGKFPTTSPSSQNLGTSNYFTSGNSASLSLPTSNMTIEGWYNLSSVPSTAGQYYTLVSKTAASPSYGWELRLQKYGSTSCRLYFFAKNGSGNYVSVNSSSTSTMCTKGVWTYFAVKFVSGKVYFYTSATSYYGLGVPTIYSRNSGTLSGVTTVPSTTNSLMIGANASTGMGSSLWFAGAIDEVRISNMARTISSGTPVPSGPWSPD